MYYGDFSMLLLAMYVSEEDKNNSKPIVVAIEMLSKTG